MGFHPATWRTLLSALSLLPTPVMQAKEIVRHREQNQFLIKNFCYNRNGKVTKGEELV